VWRTPLAPSSKTLAPDTAPPFVSATVPLKAAVEDCAKAVRTVATTIKTKSRTSCFLLCILIYFSVGGILTGS
jgi:hypothetical protein